MKKTYEIQDLDCANCAAKMESAIKKIAGVNDASVSFINQKLSIDAQDSQLENIINEVERIIKKIEPDSALIR